MNSASDLYLRGAFEMNPSPTAPGPAAALDTLLRLSYQMQDMPFQYGFIDKPRSGTSAIVFHDPARPHWPSDGVRYLSQAQDPNNSAAAGEKLTVSAHTLPNNVAGRVELETGVVTGGIFPPSNPAIPLSKDSPDLQLARYRIRWRIKTPNLGNPALWLVYWGRDERATQRAPAGWEREVIRRYPLPTIPADTPPQQPLRTGTALPPPPLIESVYPTVSASPPPHILQQQQQQQHQEQQQHFSRHPSQPPYQQQQHQSHPSLPPSMQHPGPPPPNYPMYQQARQQSMSVGPPPGSSQGMPQLQPQPLPQIQQHQQPQSRRNTPKQSSAAANRKPPPPGLGKPGSGNVPQPQPNQAIAAATQPQISALQAIPPHLRAAVGASAAHSSFPQSFSDPYDYLSSRSWAGLRYERNHAVVAPLFDPSTTTEIMESWIEPSFPDLEKIKEEISMLQKEVEVLKAQQAQLPGRGLFSVSTLNAGGEATTSTSQSLARKTSAASAPLPAGKDTTRQKDFDALLAPLPRMMSIAEMQDKAMQAHNARRKEIEDALQAQRQAKEEEERIERERVEAEEAAKRAMEEEAKQKEQREREAQEEEARRQQQQREVGEKAKMGSQIGMAYPSTSTTQSQGAQQSNQPLQYDQAGGRQGDSTTNTSGNNSVYGEDANRSESGLNGVGGGGAGENYFDDSYNLLMDNFNMYENNGTGFTMPGDEMMDDSLFSEYMDQMGSM